MLLSTFHGFADGMAQTIEFPVFPVLGLPKRHPRHPLKINEGKVYTWTIVWAWGSVSGPLSPPPEGRDTHSLGIVLSISNLGKAGQVVRPRQPPASSGKMEL